MRVLSEAFGIIHFLISFEPNSVQPAQGGPKILQQGMFSGVPYICGTHKKESPKTSFGQFFLDHTVDGLMLVRRGGDVGGDEGGGDSRGGGGRTRPCMIFASRFNDFR